MNEKYINELNDMFFDVNDNEAIKALLSNINQVLGDIIIRYGLVINRIQNDNSREKKYADFIISLLCRKVMEHIDAINILIEKASFSQAQIILRTLMETVVGLKYILKDDSDNRAAAYFLYHHYEDSLG